MFRLKRILFPVDFSERSRGAAAYVEMFAGRFDAEVTLLYVIEPPKYNSALSDSFHVQPQEFDSFLGPDWRHLRTVRLVEKGEAAERIVACAARMPADLIMIPTQGLGTYRRLILGSSTAKVLHDSDCPVWTGVHLENAPPPEKISFHRVVCAVDLKAASTLILDWAHHFAAEYGAALTLLHVAREDDQRFHAEETLRGLQEAVHSKATQRVEVGDPATDVARVAEECKADLLVIGRKAVSGVHGRLETTSYSIIRRSPCPVVSV